MATGDTLAGWDAQAGRPLVSSPATLDVRNEHVVLDFEDSGVNGATFFGVLPQNYGSNDLLVLLTWAATSATSGDVFWAVGYERHPINDPTNGTYDLDVSDFSTDLLPPVSAAPTNSGEMTTHSRVITTSVAKNPKPGETFRLQISRDATEAADTMVGDAQLLSVELREA